MDTNAGVHSQIMVKRATCLLPLRLSPVDILAHVMLGLISTAFDNAFVQVRKTFSVLSRFAHPLVSC